MNQNLRNEIDNCGECQTLKSQGIIPGCCQFHIDKQFEVENISGDDRANYVFENELC